MAGQAAGAVSVTGYKELRQHLSLYDSEVDKALRSDMRLVAKPVQREAESLMRARITNVGSQWSKARVGVTRSLVYVVPSRKGPRSGPRKRPNFGDLAQPLFEEALEGHSEQIVKDVEEVIDKVGARLGLT